MDRFNRKGQALIETVILGVLLFSFFILMEGCYGKIKPTYEKHKIQSKHRRW